MTSPRVEGLSTLGPNGPRNGGAMDLSQDVHVNLKSLTTKEKTQQASREKE